MTTINVIMDEIQSKIISQEDKDLTIPEKHVLPNVPLLPNKVWAKIILKYLNVGLWIVVEIWVDGSGLPPLIMSLQKLSSSSCIDNQRGT